MKLFFLSILLVINTTIYSQSNHENILTYKHGCQGNCIFSYEDTCAISKDSMIEVINITRNNNLYYKDGIPLSKHKSDSLNTFLLKKIIEIERLDTEVENEQNAKFVSPKPKCFEFEEYQIIITKGQLNYTLLNHEMNKNGSYLNDIEIELFKELNGLIK